MLELCLVLIVAAVFLPDLFFGLVLAVLWLAEKFVIGLCHLVLMALQLGASSAASLDNASTHFRAHRGSTAR